MPLDGNDDGGWGRESALIPTNMLDIYRPEDPCAKHYIQIIAGANHTGRLFIHDTCEGLRHTYTAKHVNTLLASKDNPDGIKERIVLLIPRLSDEQKKWLAAGISDEALRVVESIAPDVATSLRLLQHDIKKDSPTPNIR